MIAKQVAIKALRTPYKPILDYALTYVSLSDKERSCVELCLVRGNTEEETADRLQRSRDFVAKHKKRGFEKVCQAWSKTELCDIIEQLTDYK